eukprot:6563848-Prymnesium_polylepis.2
MDFGAFVQMDGCKGRAEGLVHVSLIGNAAVRSPHDVVKRGQPCFVKVLSVTGTKLTLSMKDADQKTGEDLSPHMRLPGAPKPADGGGGAGGSGSSSSNPMRPDGGKRTRDDDDGHEPMRPVKRLTSPEKFEAQQLIASGAPPLRHRARPSRHLRTVHPGTAHPGMPQPGMAGSGNQRPHGRAGSGANAGGFGPRGMGKPKAARLHTSQLLRPYAHAESPCAPTSPPAGWQACWTCATTRSLTTATASSTLRRRRKSSRSS